MSRKDARAQRDRKEKPLRILCVSATLRVLLIFFLVPVLSGLGVLLYEMLTGQLPFKGDYHEAIIYSILNEDQEPITGLRTGVPMEL